MPMNEVIMIGYGGHGFVAADILLGAGLSVIGYCDSMEKQVNPYDLSYLGTEQFYFSNNAHLNQNAFVAIGNSGLRQKVFNFLRDSQIQVINAIHSNSVVAKRNSLGKGVFVAAGAVINPACCIGDGVICNTSSSIDHECVVGDFSHICPGTVLCGNVTVGNHSFVGANSVIKPGVQIADNVIIGAGSVVVGDLLEKGLYYGNPAKKVDNSLFGLNINVD
jgi:sugar O-acyltransferase (sialic acid O-acetyltransferase NeuD family)